MTTRRVVVAGGGTGGHVFLSLAIAEALVERGVERSAVTLIGSSRGQERTLASDAGFHLVLQPGRGIRRSVAPRALVANLAAVVGLIAACATTMVRFSLRRPDAVVSVGGYGALSSDLAASVLKIPLVLVTIDAVPGAVHRLFSRRARAHCVSFPTTAVPRKVLTGTPIRAELLKSQIDQRTGRAQLGLDEEGVVVAFVGGSLGAQQINEAALAIASRLTVHPEWQILHITGRRNFDALSTSAAAHGTARYKMMPFCEDMAAVYRATDIYVGRAGATSVAELCAFGVPSVLVPLPGAPSDHQRMNARALVAAGGAVLLTHDALDAVSLEVTLRGLLEDTTRRRRMHEAAMRLHRDDSAHLVATVVLGDG